MEKAILRSIQEAINSLPDSSAGPALIFIKKGIYKEKIFITKHNIILEGKTGIKRSSHRILPEMNGVATIQMTGV